MNLDVIGNAVTQSQALFRLIIPTEIGLNVYGGICIKRAAIYSK